MTVILALAAILDFWRLTENGFANLYYAAAVRSMAESWHAFFFVGYDSGGYITIDKPPLGFWAQVASVRLFGFTSLGVLFPQALAGVLSVGTLWRIVRRTFGPLVGVLAALALAISPINVVVNRSNVLEPLLLLTLLLAAWTVLRATDDGSLGWLLVWATLIGLGFNIKMLEAYLVVPALAVVYLLGAPVRWRTRFIRLALAGALLLVVSLVWATAVDLTPTAQRPYVASSQNDSELGLAFGYNGLIRLVGAGSHPHAAPQGVVKIVPLAKQAHLTLSTLSSLAVCTAQLVPASTPQLTTSTPDAPDPYSVTGRPGLLRLWQPFPGAQVSWLLPLALVGLLLGVFESVHAYLRRRAMQTPQKRGSRPVRLPWRLTCEQQGYALWGGWLLTVGLFLSVAQFINVYYVAILAPAICALAAVGAVRLWQMYRADGLRGMRGWRSCLLPLALLATIAEQAYLVGAAQDWASWLRVTILLDVALVAGLLLALPLMWRTWDESEDDAASDRARSERDPRRKSLTIGVSSPQTPGAHLLAWAAPLALAALLLTPLLWSVASLTPGNSGAFPVAGPEYAQVGAAPTSPDALVDPRLLSYLAAHRNGAAYLVATVDSYTASPIIVATGQPVMSLGGYSGGDSVLTVDQLAGLVAHNTVRLFLIPSTNVTPAQRARLYPSSWRTHLTQTHQVGRAVNIQNATTSTETTAYTNALTAWVSANCTPIQPILWNSAPYATYRLGPLQLFAC